MGEISWKLRLAIVLSCIWLVIVIAGSQGQREALTLILVFGIAPLVLLWGTAWVWPGYRKQRRKLPHISIRTNHRPKKWQHAAIMSNVPKNLLLFITVLATVAYGLSLTGMLTPGEVVLRVVIILAFVGVISALHFLFHWIRQILLRREMKNPKYHETDSSE